ncbi:hypothetical protein FF38_14546 [Lucilia cuprina]|uniref:Pleiotropic ABC efflux transporter N-terminal domain-containing protein n=1 Tax=Lucilia cuprina TaxID=7375 RepID=A0A0L0C9I4_LUCCU|nr:hypothetical protein FF38_14546 [Lucilia cuprina]
MSAERPEVYYSADKAFDDSENEHIRDIARTISRASSGNTDFGKLDLFHNQDPELDPNSPEFSVKKWSRALYNVFREDPERYPRAEMGVSFKNLAAHGVAQDVNYQLTVGNLLTAATEKGFARNDIVYWFRYP